MMPCLPIFYLTLLTAEKESALCRENTDKPEVQNRHSHLPFQPVAVLLISVLTNLPYSVALGSPELENPIMGFPALENPLVCFSKMRTSNSAGGEQKSFGFKNRAKREKINHFTVVKKVDFG